MFKANCFVIDLTNHLYNIHLLYLGYLHNLLINCFRVKIAWSPCNNHNLKEIMMIVGYSLKAKDYCLNSSASLENSVKTNYMKILCGVQFDDSLANNQPLPKNINITIR